MDYYSQLLAPEWKSKRLKILQRDNFSCTQCGNKKDLQVHHKKYDKNKLAWEYTNNNLITLCIKCHTELHNSRHISTFFKKNNKNVQKKLTRDEKLRLSLSKKDYELQKLYDKIKK
jgi:5-methylcytosine-specific restriction endonuclease McrA